MPITRMVHQPLRSRETDIPAPARRIPGIGASQVQDALAAPIAPRVITRGWHPAALPQYLKQLIAQGCTLASNGRAFSGQAGRPEATPGHNHTSRLIDQHDKAQGSSRLKPEARYIWG